MFFIKTEPTICVVISPFASYIQDFVQFHLERLDWIPLGYTSED